MARAKSAQRDERLAALAAELHGTPRGLLPDSDRSLITGMLRALVDRLADDLRARIVPGRGWTARERAALAGLGSDAALVPLRRAGVLAETALIEAAYHRLLEFHLGAAGPDRGRAAAKGATDPVAAILSRADPEVRQALTAFLVAQAKRRDAYGNPVLSPSELAPATRAALYWAIAVMLRGALGPDEGTAPGAREETIETATLEAIAAADADDASAALAGRLVAAGLAGPDMLAPLLATSETGLFGALFAQLTGIAPVRLLRFLFETGGELLAVCAKSIGMTRDDLAAILEATRGARQRPRAVTGGEIAAALDLYDRIDAETVAKLMRHWARRSDFLWMQRRLDNAADPAPAQSARR